MSRYRNLILIAGFVCGLACSDVQAFDGYGYGYFPWFGYGNNGPAAYSLGNIPAPPYFALHPPVYYSHVITPRSYGRSPFACSCNCHPGGFAAARVVVNPHLQVKAVAPAAPKSTEKPVTVAVVPAVIANPFYEKLGGEGAVATE